MYRQVWVNPQDCDFLRVLWRKDSSEPVQHYRLLTVTYGTKSAPFLAIKALRESTSGFESVYPEADHRITNDFYVDELLSGADDEEQAVHYIEQITKILLNSGFELRKWASSYPEIIKQEQSQPVQLRLAPDADTVKALGIHWYPSDDSFGFKVNFVPNNNNTKRQMLSDASRLFDPFGWLAPVIVKIKILYQQLWLYDVNWDDRLPPTVEAEWENIKHSLSQLESIRIPRFIAHSKGRVQLHGFSDASEQAYSAVVYSSYVDAEGNKKTVLVAAKSRVAPIKQITLPRLELSGALLLTELMKKITEDLPRLEIEHYAYTDSTIVLQWLSSHPRCWKTFVANRTATILEFLPRNRWNHVSSECNPADCASRGITPGELTNHSLWFYGPAWLQKDEAEWPLNRVEMTNNNKLEVRNLKTMHTNSVPFRECYDIEHHLLDRRSSFTLIVRTLACINRFISNVKLKSSLRRSGMLEPCEIHDGKLQLIRAAQQDVFFEELKLLRSGNTLNAKNRLAPLYPFLDDTGTMRVGGRLENSGLSFENKHPLILPKVHRITQLLVRELHLRHFHAGPTLLTAIINQHYWIVGLQSVLREAVHNCVRCARMKARLSHQLMGNLPPARVLALRAFSFVGVDYAGPLQIKATCVRGVKVTKGYIVVYVCLSTKAIHLEAASEMSANTFISTLKKFISRRGYPHEIRSDNGSNFVGANRLLKEFAESIKANHKEAEWYATNLGIKWVFNPPSAPHMGGIWEAAVKRVKFHLVAELGNEAISYEDLTTILCQIEACLNSRPLCPLSSNPDCCEVLTPGHFLVGQSMTLIPEPSVKHVPRNRLDHWQDLQYRCAKIWSRWKDEYLATLQPRTKWRSVQANLLVGQLVLVKNDNAPPTKWELARVQEVHPDASGIVRTVTLKRGTTTYQRPIHKLCVLPVD